MNERSLKKLEARIVHPSEGGESRLATDTVREAARLFQKHGILLLENSLERRLIENIRDDFLRSYASKSPEEIRKTCLHVGHRRYMFTIQLESPYMDPALYAAPLVFPIVQALLGKHCIIQSIGVVCAYPGSEIQHVHRDNPPLFPEIGGFSAMCPPYAMHVVIPLVDLDETTGSTAVWEGSHRAGIGASETQLPKEGSKLLDASSMVWARMGDCYFMDFRLLHAGTANISAQPRPLLYLVYSRPWFEDRSNFNMQLPLQISREEYERIPRENLGLFRTAVAEDKRHSRTTM